ncbi:MORN repeat-containing protein 1 [Balamuthia mandrillaris]
MGNHCVQHLSIEEQSGHHSDNCIRIRFDGRDPSCPYLLYEGEYKEVRPKQTIARPFFPFFQQQNDRGRRSGIEERRSKKNTTSSASSSSDHDDNRQLAVMLDGKGTMVWKNGDEYQGQWKRNQRHGSGSMTWWCIPSGERKEKKKKDEEGREKQSYEGQWKKDQRHGHGKMMWSDGSKYFGEWRNDEQHGVGVFIYPNGQKWVGAWKNGERVVDRGYPSSCFDQTKKQRRSRKWGEEVEWEKDAEYEFVVQVVSSSFGGLI